MADLKTDLEHKRGGSIKVGQTTYEIDAGGVCRGVSAQHATVMLANPAWKPYKEKGAVRTPPGTGEKQAEEAKPEPDEAAEEALKPKRRGRGR